MTQRWRGAETMTDKPTRRDLLQAKPPSGGLTAYLRSSEPDIDGTEASCKAFGYLRGIKERASSVEFRFRNGNSTWFSYAWMGTWQLNLSEGLLLKFSGDLVYLVLIRGSNLDKPLNEGAINLTHAGLQRQRVLWIREMTTEEIWQVRETGPTIDSIEVAEFESHEELLNWINKKAPAFLRSS
ncbi:MAG TPA: hypothetical protein VE988_15980 [Gemmataceae bacterium]|nr:hypothetical protein [Gemmataceae bacterium]